MKQWEHYVPALKKDEHTALSGMHYAPPQWEGHDGHPFHFEEEGGYLLYFEEFILFAFCISTVRMQYL